MFCLLLSLPHGGQYLTEDAACQPQKASQLLHASAATPPAQSPVPSPMRQQIPCMAAYTGHERPARSRPWARPTPPTRWPVQPLYSPPESRSCHRGYPHAAHTHRHDAAPPSPPGATDNARAPCRRASAFPHPHTPDSAGHGAATTLAHRPDMSLSFPCCNLLAYGVENEQAYLILVHDPPHHRSVKDLLVHICWDCQVEEALGVVVLDSHAVGQELTESQMEIVDPRRTQKALHFNSDLPFDMLRGE